MKVEYLKEPPLDLVPFAEKFAEEVHAKSKEIDPDNEHEWYSLTLGWALANKLSPADAHTFASFVRYYTNLG